MKYCIGCTHLYYTPGNEGYHYSSWTHSDGTPAEMSCRKGHWQDVLQEGFTQEKFQKAMESAETCDDYTERSPQPECRCGQRSCSQCGEDPTAYAGT